MLPLTSITTFQERRIMPSNTRKTGPKVDLAESVFGMLTVVSLDANREAKKNGCYYWICRCECGREKSVRGDILKSGTTYSCGCATHRVEWNPIDNGDGTLGIPLTKGYVALIDSIDLDVISDRCWAAQETKTNTYAVGCKNGKTIRMHDVIMRPAAGQQVDHKDGCGIRNVRSNLRCCTVSQNSCNKGPVAGKEGKYKGVFVIRKGDKIRWAASIRIEGKTTYLGYFFCQEAAARAYDAAAIQCHGEFARLNFPATA